MAKARTISVIKAEIEASRAAVTEAKAKYQEAEQAYNKTIAPLSEVWRKAEESLRTLEDELRVLEVETNPAPAKVGDVVEDEFGVRYRVTAVHAPSRHGQWVGKQWVEGDPGLWTVFGIRLSKAGVEAYANPRQIHSPHLTVVQN